MEPRGLVLVTGPAGSGKTTTLASMVNHMNHNRADHIVTIEDPIEYLFEDGSSIVTQREVGMDAPGFAEALRICLRQDPNVVMVGEMRDVETMSDGADAGGDRPPRPLDAPHDHGGGDGQPDHLAVPAGLRAPDPPAARAGPPGRRLAAAHAAVGRARPHPRGGGPRRNADRPAMHRGAEPHGPALAGDRRGPGHVRDAVVQPERDRVVPEGHGLLRGSPAHRDLPDRLRGRGRAPLHGPGRRHPEDQRRRYPDAGRPPAPRSSPWPPGAAG